MSWQLLEISSLALTCLEGYTFSSIVANIEIELFTWVQMVSDICQIHFCLQMGCMCCHGEAAVLPWIVKLLRGLSINCAASAISEKLSCKRIQTAALPSQKSQKYARLVTLICVICFQWHWRHSSKPESLLRHSCIGVGVFDINCCYVAPQKSQKYCKSRSRGGQDCFTIGSRSSRADILISMIIIRTIHLHQNYLLSSWS